MTFVGGTIVFVPVVPIVQLLRSVQCLRRFKVQCSKGSRTDSEGETSTFREFRKRGNERQLAVHVYNRAGASLCAAVSAAFSTDDPV
jgi:hypothetical protein